MSRRKMSRGEFVKRACVIHNNKYDYSNVVYNGSHEKVSIVCPKHGEFRQFPWYHLTGAGCPKCKHDALGDVGNTNRLTKEQFVEKSRFVHGDRYDYSKSVYVNGKTKVCIICPEHGEFWQKPSDHLHGQGCPFCANNRPLNNCEFIRRARFVHGAKYDYSKVNYTFSNVDVCIICPEHGEFWQTPNNHLMGHGCPKCMLFGSSKVEELLYVRLCEIFGEDDIIRHYKSESYPFKCDFYIKSRDLYIELNAFWMHGFHWYDENSEDDCLLLCDWRQKSGSAWHSAVCTWTIRDMKKREIARKNNLNYVVFWDHTLEDAKKWFELGCPDGEDWDHEYSWLSK